MASTGTRLRAPVRKGGRFRMNVVLRRSGRFAVTGRNAVTAARPRHRPPRADALPRGHLELGPDGQGGWPVCRVHHHRISELDGQRIDVPGHLLRASKVASSISTSGSAAIGGASPPLIRGRAAASTCARAPRTWGSRRLRVPVQRGPRERTRAQIGIGTLTVYRMSVASWYYDVSATACGFHTTLWGGEQVPAVRHSRHVRVSAVAP